MTSHKKPGVAFWATMVVVVGIPVAAYFTAYWWCVEPSRSGIFSLPVSVQRVVASYPRLGDSRDWEAFFAPANCLDRRLRPKVWQDVVVHLPPPVLAPPLPSYLRSDDGWRQYTN